MRGAGICVDNGSTLNAIYRHECGILGEQLKKDGPRGAPTPTGALTHTSRHRRGLVAMLPSYLQRREDTAATITTERVLPAVCAGGAA